MEVDRLAAESYVVLTTFRRDGRAVPTPVWIAGDGAELVLWSERKAGKVKRIRNNGRVEVQASDFRGTTTHGPKVSGQARLLDDDATRRVCRLIARKYGIVGQVTMFFSRLRGGPPRTVAIAITLDPPTDPT
jgi:PPOX class probable F420-dependent enzyme